MKNPPLLRQLIPQRLSLYIGTAEHLKSVQTNGLENTFALIILAADLARMPRPWVVGLADLGVRVIDFNDPTIAHRTHALTLDAHFMPNLADIARLLEASRKNPSAIILGRLIDPANLSPSPGTPGEGWGGGLHREGSGAKTSLLVFLETGVRVADSRCALRIYPLRRFDILPARVDSWMHPTEILVRAAWAGCPILEVPVEPGFAALQARPTPWRKLRAFAGDTYMHARLLARALSGRPHWQHQNAEARARQPFWSGFWHWLNPMRAWRELRQGGASRSEMAAGIAIGVFIANLPAYGVQTLLALYSARRLHLHPAAVVVGSKISTPPIGPILIVAAVWLGHLMLHGSRLTRADFGPINAHLFARMAPMLLDWLVGSVVIGAAMAVGAFAVARALFQMTAKRNEMANDE